MDTLLECRKESGFVTDTMQITAYYSFSESFKWQFCDMELPLGESKRVSPIHSKITVSLLSCACKSHPIYWNHRIIYDIFEKDNVAYHTLFGKYEIRDTQNSKCRIKPIYYISSLLHQCSLIVLDEKIIGPFDFFRNGVNINFDFSQVKDYLYH